MTGLEDVPHIPPFREHRDRDERFHFHMGRSWVGSALKDDCPCGKAACGLVDSDLIDPDCPQHAIGAMKTMRQMHTPASCPGVEEPDLVIDLSGCARCHGEGHPGLELRKLTYPGDTGRGIIFTHWAPCPTNGEPIFYASGVVMPKPLKQGKEMVEEDA